MVTIGTVDTGYKNIVGVEKYLLITDTFSILINKTVSQNMVLITGVLITGIFL